MKNAICAVSCLALLVCAASAHPGRTDASGGHYNRSTGEYHYHHGYSAHQHTDGICPYDDDNQTSQSSSFASTEEWINPVADEYMANAVSGFSNSETGEFIPYEDVPALLDEYQHEAETAYQTGYDEGYNEGHDAGKTEGANLDYNASQTVAAYEEDEDTTRTIIFVALLCSFFGFGVSYLVDRNISKKDKASFAQQYQALHDQYKAVCDENQCLIDYIQNHLHTQ